MAESLPTGRELQALKVLWQRRRATVREVHRDLRPDDGELPYTTVLSLMQLLEKKGLVGHEVVGKAYVYYPKTQRNRAFRNLAREFLDRVFDGSMEAYLACAMESRRPSAEELDRLEKMIAEAKKRARKPPKKGGKR